VAVGLRYLTRISYLKTECWGSSVSFLCHSPKFITLWVYTDIYQYISKATL